MKTSASEPELVHFARSRSRQNVLLGAGAGILPRAGAGADQKCHGFTSLIGRVPLNGSRNKQIKKCHAWEDQCQE